LFVVKKTVAVLVKKKEIKLLDISWTAMYASYISGRFAWFHANHLFLSKEGYRIKGSFWYIKPIWSFLMLQNSIQEKTCEDFSQVYRKFLMTNRLLSKCD